MAVPERNLIVEKRKLREQMMARRLQLPPASTSVSAQAVARHFADHPILAFAPSFAGYISHRGEVDVLPVFDAMTKFNKQTALPATTPQKTLIFRRWSRGQPLLRHPGLSIEEPPSNFESVIPSVVMVPLLAFDSAGFRLGYGGGYYDRTMEAMRQFETPPLFIGVAFSMQELDSLPVDDHDQQLDGILTELGVSMFRGYL